MRLEVGTAMRRASRPTARSARGGFTLVELLVVIAIIGVLVGLLLPAVQAAREAGRRVSCSNNLKQVGLGILTYTDARKEFPSGRNEITNMGIPWSFRVLPFMEQNTIYDAYDSTVPAPDPKNASAMRTAVPTFFCPSRRAPCKDRNFDNNNDPPPSNWMGVAAGGDVSANPGLSLTYNISGTQTIDGTRAGPIYTRSHVRPQHVTDGLSKTFAVGERHIPTEPEPPPSSSVLLQQKQGDTAFFSADTPNVHFREAALGLADGPTDRTNSKFGSMHPGLCQFLFLDGHVEALPVDTERLVLRWYAVIGDGADPTNPPDEPTDPSGPT